jgi:hypothetical protein
VEVISPETTLPVKGLNGLTLVVIEIGCSALVATFMCI